MPVPWPERPPQVAGLVDWCRAPCRLTDQADFELSINWWHSERAGYLDEERSISNATWGCHIPDVYLQRLWLAIAAEGNYQGFGDGAELVEVSSGYAYSSELHEQDTALGANPPLPNSPGWRRVCTS